MNHLKCIFTKFTFPKMFFNFATKKLTRKRQKKKNICYNMFDLYKFFQNFLKTFFNRQFILKKVFIHNKILHNKKSISAEKSSYPFFFQKHFKTWKAYFKILLYYFIRWCFITLHHFNKTKILQKINFQFL